MSGVYVVFLKNIGSAKTIDDSVNIPSKTLCVFLEQELERRKGQGKLIESVTDSLILWALEETDPDREILMSKQDILNKVETVLPTAKQFIRSIIDSRLDALAAKDGVNGREIRWYRKYEKYCLPFSTRIIIAEENREDEALRIEVLELFKKRAHEFIDRAELGEEEFSISQIASRTMKALTSTFEHEGLELASFIAGDDTPDIYNTIEDQVAEILIKENVSPEQLPVHKAIILGIIRKAFYDSESIERVFFGKLSRTYALLFSLKAEPKIIEYFQGMTGKFKLYVGADIIVRALSEHFLSENDQMTNTLLKVLRAAGAELILSEAAAEEVWRHFIVNDNEYNHNIKNLEQHLTHEIAKHAPTMMLRAYLYARMNNSLGDRKPKSWGAFVGQFCTYKNLHRAAAYQELTLYLQHRFGMEFESSIELAEYVDEKAVEELADIFLTHKRKKHQDENKAKLLATNDARLAHAVYGRRTRHKEFTANPYGFRTWWLTEECAVQRLALPLIDRHHGQKFIIRPDFLLNFISLSPTTAEVRNSFNNVFPTLLGIRLSNRIKPEVFDDMMHKVQEMKVVDKARGLVMLSRFSDALKSDEYKKYENNLSDVIKA